MSFHLVSAKLNAIGRRATPKRSAVRLVAVAGVAVAATLLVASSGLAWSGGQSSKDGVRFFQGAKACAFYATTPFIVCNITQSNLSLLEGASVAYINDPVQFADPLPAGRLDSDVRLTTAGSNPSTAKGHCTFYLATGNGLCTYNGGTHQLAGFHAVLVVGTNADGTFSLIGKYWFEVN